MAKTSLIKWGNSVGIRIPANVFKAANAYIGEQFEITSNKKGGFTLTPVKKPQEGWTEAFNAIADAGHDELLINEIEGEFDQDDWRW